MDSRITKKINPHSPFTQSKKCAFKRHVKSIGDALQILSTVVYLEAKENLKKKPSAGFR